jgi:hypothetical protein
MGIIVLFEQKLCERTHTTFHLFFPYDRDLRRAVSDSYRLIGIYIGRILKGEKPGRVGPAAHAGQADDVIE